MDWQSNADASRILYQSPGVTAIATAAGTSTPPIAVGDLKAIGFEVLGVANNGSINFDFYADPGLTIFINGAEVKVNSGLGGEQASWSIPVSAPFLKITISATGANFTYKLRVWAEAIDSYIFSSDSFVANPLILFSADDVVYPIGVTDIQGMNVLPGPASFFGAANVAATFIRLYAVDGGGTRYLLSQFDNPGAGGGSISQGRVVYLPPMHLMIRIINNSAAAQFFSYALISKYGLL